jgi:hypothetical protein
MYKSFKNYEVPLLAQIKAEEPKIIKVEQPFY